MANKVQRERMVKGAQITAAALKKANDVKKKASAANRAKNVAKRKAADAARIKKYAADGKVPGSANYKEPRSVERVRTQRAKRAAQKLIADQSPAYAAKLKADKINKAKKLKTAVAKKKYDSSVEGRVVNGAKNAAKTATRAARQGKAQAVAKYRNLKGRAGKLYDDLTK